MKKLSGSVDVIPFYIYYDINKKLDGDLFIPKAETPLPVLLLRTPYGKKNMYAFYDAVELARRGFVVAVQNVRGRYESDGIFDPFINERDDSVMTTKWLSQQKWCNGQVFSIGASYEGFTAMLCSNDENLKGFASFISSSDIRNNWFHEGGAIRQGFTQAWSHSFAFTDTNRLSNAEREFIQLLANDLQSLYKLPLKDFPTGKYLPYYMDWINTHQSEYWDRITESTSSRRSQVNGYYVGGWYDIFCEGTISDYQMAVRESNLSQRMVIGPWSHGDLFSSLVGEIDFGCYNLKGYDHYDVINWFENISNDETEPSCGALIFIMGRNKWVEYPSWPPSSSIERLYFSSKTSACSVEGDGTLTWEAKSFSGTDQYTHVKSNPVPSLGGRSLDASTSYTGRGGPFDQNKLGIRKDILVYTSNSLQRENTIIGKVVVRLSVSSTSRSTMFHAKLIDVYPDGRAINILDSCTKVEFDTDKMNIEIVLGTTAYTFLEGHRIRCDIASSCFPRVSIDEDLFEPEVGQVIYWGNSEMSWIELPIVSG